MNLIQKSGRMVLAFAVLTALSLVSSAAQAADKGTVAGKVVKDTAGVSGAKVRLINPADAKGKGGKDAPAAAAPGAKGGKREAVKPVAEATTENDGSFKMADVPAGEYILVANAKGQGRAREKVSVKAGETTTVNLTLAAGKQGGGGKRKGKQ